MVKTDREIELEAKIAKLESQLAAMRGKMPWAHSGATVRAPQDIQPLFDVAQETVREYFSQIVSDPTKASIEISGERYVLLRASSLSVDFLKAIQNLYSDLDDEQAFSIGQNFLFDISHVLGMQDARNFHKKMELTEPIEKLAAGPVHFAYSGWAFVDISPESEPKPTDGFFMKYDHPFSFEADAWIKAGEKSDHPVCIMNSGYSSGWCEESFGIHLTAVELTCKAAGDEACTFIMAPPHKIEEHLEKYVPEAQRSNNSSHRIPTFFERKRIEEEMKTARQKAEESDRMKSEFLANMSHEIRTPMNSLIGMTELVLDSQLTNVQREYLNTTLESAESLMLIINQILDFSRIEAGKLELESMPFSIRECIGDTLKSLGVRAQSKGLELAWNVTRNVPDALIGDPNRLRQIIVNLVGNAIKFTDRGEIVLDMTIAGLTEETVTVHCEVRDSGIGVPDEKREMIFEPFSQADMSTTRQYGGTGLGLTISAELVDMMHGNIWVDSEPGLGSTFHFTAQFERDRAAAPQHPELANQSVLIAADKPSNRKILEETLSAQGMHVNCVDSGRSALRGLLKLKSEGRKLPLLIADTVNVLALVQAIRKRPELQGAKIIALAPGHVQIELEKLDNVEIDTLLVKPIKQSELIRAIKAANKKEVVQKTNKAEAKTKDSATMTKKADPKKEDADPAPVATKNEVQKQDGEPATTETKKRESAIKILLVEDGIANQKFAIAMLTRWGHTVDVANNGLEALEKLQASPEVYDIVLMDVLMPEMDGLQATAAIRKGEKITGKHIPIIAVTAQAMKGDKESCLEAGMDEYLSKPLRRKELQETMEKLLS